MRIIFDSKEEKEDFIDKIKIRKDDIVLIDEDRNGFICDIDTV